MEAKLEKIEKNEAYLEIEVDADTLDEALEIAYKKVVKQVQVPGFRKGRVPRQLLESHYGVEILFEDALEYVVPQAFEKAISELKIDAIAQPDFEILEIEPGKALKFKAKVAVKPEITLGKIEGVEIEVPKMEVREEDIDNRLEEMRSRYAERVEKTEGEEAILGDIIIIDFEGFIDGIAFEGGKGTDYPLEIGSNTFIPGFEEQLLGFKKGDENDVEVRFPESYHSPDLAGKLAIFKVLVKNIEGKKLRELNDDFVQEVSEFESLDELRIDIKNSLQTMLENKKTEMIKEEVLQKLSDQNEIEVPDVLVSFNLDRIKSQFGQRLAYQGLSMKQYFELTSSNEEDFNKDLWPEAERMAKKNLILEKIIEEKGFEVSDEEIESSIDVAAESMAMDKAEARVQLAGVMDSLIQNIRVDKAIAYLVENAKIVEKEIENQAPQEDSE